MPPLLSRFWIQLTADRRRFGALCALVAFGLLLWARIIVISNMPKTAVADDENQAAEELIGDDSDAQSLREPDGETAISIILDMRPARDPFVISPRHFPQPEPDPGTIADPTKSDVQPTEDVQTAESRRTRVLQELVGKLSLEAVLTEGGLAVIDGRMYRLGEKVPGAQGQAWFLLKEVQQRSVLLECEGRQFKLEIPEPGIKQGTNWS